MNNVYAEVRNRATLIFPVKGRKVVLGKKRSKVCAGYLNGYGGKVEEGESIHECAMREFTEETGGAVIIPHFLNCVGVLYVRNHDAEGKVIYECDVYTYLVYMWDGGIVSTPEMEDPALYSFEDLGEQNITIHDKVWMPEILENGKRVRVHLDFESDGKTLRDLVRLDFISRDSKNLY
ncbi:MAG: hypothetical protein CEO12_555 [Parcubacteria group bacterium Gr01-1014_46]|nr:MAG: hypothetical protein CEO12_555 [Parcubacteria group bacterium Gr01-1014_46]